MTGKRLEDIESLMQQMNQTALQVAKAFGVELDYSDESVKDVEHILSKTHLEFKQRGDDSGFRGIALFFAAYLGEVIRRKQHGGTWRRDHPEFGDDTFVFNWNGAELFLFAWCQKRIFDGPQDNVYEKYRTCVLTRLENRR